VFLYVQKVFKVSGVEYNDIKANMFRGEKWGSQMKKALFITLSIVTSILFIVGIVFIIKAVIQPSPVVIEKIQFSSDKDCDGLNDLDDIIEGARKEVQNKTVYRSEYYPGGYPPEGEGVCTDVVWRALKNAGYDLKSMIDLDISKHTSDYPRVEGKPDPNIDFRRVKNQLAFFKKYATNLTLEVKPYDIENLKQWQGGDIVTLDSDEHIDHVGIISDKRRRDGVPYVIHNGGPKPREEDRLLYWEHKLTGHFRFPNQ